MLSPLSPDKEIEALCNRCCPEMEQEIKFCTTDDGVRIAYATVGQGPPLVKAANWLNHLEFDWRSPIWRHLSEEFARSHFLVRYDERGNGLSDWDVENISFEAFVRDLEAVVNAVGLERFVLLGISQGGPVAIAYAIRHPEKVSHLVLYGSYARGWAKRGSPADEIERRQAYLTLTKLGWGQDHPAYRQLWTSLFVPDGTLEQWHWFNDLQRVSASPENAFRLLNEVGTIDVVDLLPQLKVPTLVLHCRDDAVAPFEEGRLLASLIPGARFVPLEGRNHLILENEPAWPAFVSEVRRFLGTDASKQERASDRAKGSSPTKFSQNSVLGRYRILSQLGAGGMGEVFLAVDTKLDRKVALKILPANVADDRDRMNRFVQEAKAASALNHPNIITIYEIEQIDSVNLIAIEFIDGETLRERIRKASMKLGEVLDVATQIASALSAAHAAGIVHRDIKPENVMLRRDGIVKVLDFGLAKLTERVSPESVDTEAPTRVKTEPGVVMGTAIYMSPEQARGMPVDARTDIFSLGVVLYEMVAGRLPFEGSTSSEVVSSILSEKEPQPLARYSREAPAELERIVSKALRKNRDQRYQTIKDLMLDLQSLKQQLEFEAKLERSVPPRAERAASASEDVAGQGFSVDALGRASAIGPAVVADSVGTHPVSSAEYILTAVKQHKRGVAVVLSILLLAALAVGYWFLIHRSSNVTPIDSVAVLPFVNEGGNADLEYLSDGMAESLINSLSRLPHLSVKSRSSVFRYKGKEVEPQKVASELSVQAILNGRVVQRGDDLALYLSLVDGQTGNQLWGEQYNRKLTDLAALQNEIARDVSQKLRARLSSADEQKLAKNYTENAEAYQLYLKGRYFWNKRTPEGHRKSIEYFNQAIEKDPDFALAFVGLADAYASLPFDSDAPPREAYPKAKAAATRALEIDAKLAEAFSLLAAVKFNYDWDFPGAEEELKRAIVLNPNDAIVHQRYARYLSLMGRHQEAIAEAKRARELDPLSLLINALVGDSLFYAHQYDQAIEELRKPLEIEPNFWIAHLYLGKAYEQKRMYPESIAELQKARDFSGDISEPISMMGYVYAVSGRRSEAQHMLNELKERSKQRYVPPYNIAMVYVGLGEKEQAFQWLDKAYEDRNQFMARLKTEPKFDGLRSDPRFADLVRRVGL